MKRQYIVSERAHFMCPNMHFGIVMELNKAFDEVQTQAVLERMAQAHPFLRSRIAYEEGTEKLYYNVTDRSQISLMIREDVSSLWEDYAAFSGQDWNVFENGMLILLLYPQERGMTLLFAAHHLLVDGRGLLELAQEFADDYVGGKAPVYAEECLLQSIDDLPEKSGLPWISRMLVRNANRQWRKENHRVSYEQYRVFTEMYGKAHPTAYQTYELNADTVKEMNTLCRENGFTMNDLLMAEMYLRTGTKKIIIAADIRNRFAGYQKGALGNYSTAMGIVCKSKTTDVVEKAKEVHTLVRKHMSKNSALMLVLACYFEMDPGLLDAAAISALGGFESKAGRFVGQGMFGFGSEGSYSITNLGRVENENISSMTFIPPASPAAKLTLGVLTCNGVLRACSSTDKTN